ncbi:MAG: DegV family EDD domain-containing protein [Deltaproteobacteria bacterium]|nr:DegV family EDD domain-containing protein [Deltaproteobacteria bacterium]
MNADFFDALRAGTERISVWADLLDRINVFPVADGDTGRNLLVSLLPLKSPVRDRSAIVEKLFVSARGNSGNIAAQFFTGFLSYENSGQFAQAVETGTQRAWRAIADPRPGTMLSVFDELNHALKESSIDDRGTWIPGVLKRIHAAVSQTTQTLPVLKNAHVVDSGALGMFIFFDAFLNTLYTNDAQFAPVHDLFREYLTVQETWSGSGESGACIDAVVQLNKREQKSAQSIEELSALGVSLVSQTYGGRIKIHIHTRDQSALRNALSHEGSIIQWASDDLEAQTKAFSAGRISQAIHIVTDAAGSISRDHAKQLGMTLLDSYITMGIKDAPETYIDRSELYQAMRKGIKVTTSQASTFERHQHYEKLVSLYGTALYLCVGSAFTGNFRVVMDWKKDHDPEDCLKVIDTGAASGRLGIIAAASAQYAMTASSGKDVLDFAVRAVSSSEEYIFLDTLHFLAAGGRLSKTSAVFGDMLRMKPVVSPLPEGAKKVAVVRNKKEQIAFAMEKLGKAFHADDHPLIMIEYTDNKEWVESDIAAMVHGRFPHAELVVQSLSLTTGVHTGPGTWGIAFLPR